jgi:DNA polymerase-3 subunit beta
MSADVLKASSLREDIAKGLSIVGKAVATRSTLPVLGNILVATDNGRLKLSATNLEIGVTCWVSANVEEDGATTVPAHTLVDLVNALEADLTSLELNTRTETLNIKCGRFNNNVRGIVASEFPLLPSVNGHQGLSVPPDILRRAIERTVFAASSDESRIVLTGVLAKFHNTEDGRGQLTMAAADGFRISECKADLGAPVEQPVSAVIPARAMAELERVLRLSGPQFTPQENPVGLFVTGNQVLFHLDNVDMVCQLIDGAFPDYAAVVPKKHTTRAVINAAEMLKACKAAQVFARESAQTVKLTIARGDDVSAGHTIVAATSAETGDNAGKVDAAVEGEPLEIAFNVKYLLEMLGAVGASHVTLEATTPTTPAMVRPVGEDGFIHVLMPMTGR